MEGTSEETNFPYPYYCSPSSGRELDSVYLQVRMDSSDTEGKQILDSYEMTPDEFNERFDGYPGLPEL
ncbi:hypothetical protein ACIRIU_14165 [Streptomyces sp. NPDC102351]|uniref:hypothetical protein n=1 Tax=unclassified Streptomyces TaxID=2593676 RepID=UPI0037D916F0